MPERGGCLTQQLSTDPVATFIFVAAVYPVCAALTFYRPMQCRRGRIVLWWAGIMGSMLLKAWVQLGESQGFYPPGIGVIVSTAVNFVAPLLFVYCFEESLAVKGICYCLAVVCESAITMPGIVFANYRATHAESSYELLGYLAQTVLQFVALFITIKLLRIAKVRVSRWNPTRVEQLGVAGGLIYLIFVSFAAVTGYRSMEDGTMGLLELVVTVLMLQALLFAVVFEAHSVNTTLRDAVSELSDCRSMQYNALRMQQKTLDELHMVQHDINNHYLALRGFLARGETARAEEYLRELTENAPAPAAHYTENTIADVALAEAAMRCKEQDVAFAVSGILPAELPVTATDLGCLLYNLLSNAIEGALRAPAPRSVAIRFAVKAGQLCITVTNTVQPGTIVHGGTSKADAKKHGFGTRIIRDITKRYDGVYVLRMSNGRAESDTMLDLTGSANKCDDATE